jgi:hypothetical protein
MLQWQPGWVQKQGDMAKPFFSFWVFNFGLWLAAALLLVGRLVARVIDEWREGKLRPDAQLTFLSAALALFLLACLVKTAPWEWDNIKIIVWAYLIMLPFLWQEVIRTWPIPVRTAVCFGLFFSGFISLLGGLATGRGGFDIVQRGELTDVSDAITRHHLEGRFAGYPTYNHPVLLSGRPMVMGYPGHLWTQGINYDDTNNKLRALMLGAANWRDLAKQLGVRYLFWGREEKLNYPRSARSWERELQPIFSDANAAIYDLEGPLPLRR